MKLRIFVFDRDNSLQNLLSIIVGKKGHEVLAFSEPSACPLYSNSGCTCPQGYACGDLMILDNRMLKMSGIDLIRKQMAHGCKGAVLNKLVFSTSKPSKEELRVSEELGFRLMRKPFSVKELSAWIDECESRIDPNRKLADIGLGHLSSGTERSGQQRSG